VQSVEINLNNPEAQIREIRLSSIITYRGSAADLCRQSGQGTLCCEDCSFNQSGECSAQRAIIQVSAIRDAAVVNHGPIGCAGDFATWNKAYRDGLVTRGYQTANIRALSSNLEEKDTVYGGTEKLEATVREAKRRFQPRVIFVMASCASGIIGDDIEGTIERLEAELGIPIVSVYCEGFKSKVWTSGFDAAFHGIMRKIVKPPQEKQPDLINIVNFSGRHVFTPLLTKIGLRTTYIVPYSSVEQLEKISEAAATTHICETLGTYIAQSLEQAYGVPEVKSPVPYGLAWTDAWLREIGRITRKELEVEQLIKAEREKIYPALQALREKLRGKKVYIFAGDAYAHNLVSVTRDLEMNVVGVTAYHHDLRFDTEDERVNSLKNILDTHGDVQNYHIFTKQPYQAINILKKLQPDVILFRHPQMAILGTKLGIPSLFIRGDANLYACYDGVIETGEKISQALGTTHLIKNISRHAKLPYTEWWYQQDPFTFLAR
jgi:nitrogenase molybdenum-iron protein alpha chain